MLLLRTLFGFDLWGSLRGIELRGQPPASTAVLPASILSRCDGAAAPSQVRMKHQKNFQWLTFLGQQ